MHRTVRKLLKSAVGESRLVVVVFLDIRGFSSFAKLAESSETALFLRSAYSRILDDYFPDASFFKPTGDGLLIVIDYDEATVDRTVIDSLARAIRLVEEFPSLCSSDKMVNFDVPGALGIGLARGAATCLTSGDVVLDYSGRPLNLASRLMDLARPLGVVFDSSFVHGVDVEELREEFHEEPVFIKGLAEDDPITVLVLNDTVEVPEFNWHPINRSVTKVVKVTEEPFKELLTYEKYVKKLEAEPIDPQGIQVRTKSPKALPNGRKHKSLRTNRSFKAEYIRRGGEPYARIDFNAIGRTLVRDGVKPMWKVEVTLEYDTRA
ncbi:MAG TPA: hypothetical protein VFQ85_04005 [Mycobacteriales bacterium]|jgi:class 3 adenylate cyclase|nr:hypothetical protein [Mycobacteriales bacterium]